VGHGDDRAGVALQVVLQPGHRLGIQVVGGLVQQQDVRLLQEQAAQCHAALLATGQGGGFRLGGWAAQGIHGHLQPRVEIPGIRCVQFFLHRCLAFAQRGHLLVGHGLGEPLVDAVELVQKVYSGPGALFDDLPHRLFRVQGRFLLQKADRQPGGQDGLADEVLVHTGQDSQQGTLARAVEAQDSDLCPVEIRQGNVLQHLPLVIKLAHTHHGVNHFFLFRTHSVIRSSSGCYPRPITVRGQ